MSVSNGQPADASTLNAAFASKSADNTLTGELTLNHSGSGAQVTDVQQAINDLLGDVAALEAEDADDILPSQTGNNGKYLKTNGTTASWETVVVAAANLSVTSKTAAYSITTSDDVILCSASGGAYTVTLPTAVGNSGKVFRIKKTDSSSNAVTVGTTSSQTIDGATTYSISMQYETLAVVSDGSNWSAV